MCAVPARLPSLAVVVVVVVVLLFVVVLVVAAFVISAHCRQSRGSAVFPWKNQTLPGQVVYPVGEALSGDKRTTRADGLDMTVLTTCRPSPARLVRPVAAVAAVVDARSTRS